ncbi:MAG: hypothetical protein K0U72_12075 [Gammaproteobacteria bacterium]|nr:hypothetical protein [Gammaproteobacteria bacterium]
MSADLDSILHKMSTATAHCYDLNSNGLLTIEEQTVFFQLAEHTLFLTSQIHAQYDRMDVGLSANPGKTAELHAVWDTANTNLEDFKRNITSPKMRSAVSATAFANQRTNSISNELLP